MCAVFFVAAVLVLCTKSAHQKPLFAHFIEGFKAKLCLITWKLQSKSTNLVVHNHNSRNIDFVTYIEG